MSSSMSAGGGGSAGDGGSGNSRRRGVFSLGRYRGGLGQSPSATQQLLSGSGDLGGTSGKPGAVKYMPRQDRNREDRASSTSGGTGELEEIAVVSISGVQSGQLTYGTAGASMANGPRVVPGIITSARLMEDRLAGSGTRINTVASSTSALLSAGSTEAGGIVGGVGSVGLRGLGSGGSSSSSFMPSVPSSLSGRVNPQQRSLSKHSLLEIVSSRIGGATAITEGGGGNAGGSSTGLIKGNSSNKRFSKESFSAACVSKATLPQPVLPVPTAGNSGGDSKDEAAIELIPRRSRDARRRDLKKRWEASAVRLEPDPTSPPNGSSGRSGGCRWTFVFDPAGRLCYYWSLVVSLAFLYNFWVLIYRFAFQEITSDTLVMWLCLDYFCDLIYALDIAFHFRTGYLEEGVLQTDATKLRQHYMNSTTFYVDCLCLLPLDFLYLSIGYNSMLRCFRLVKIYRFWTFMDRTERHTNYPNVFRSISLLHYLLVIFHWNACLYRIVMRNNNFDQSVEWERLVGTVGPSSSGGVNALTPDLHEGVGVYLQSFYLCTLTLTTTGGVLKPRTKGELLFVIIQLIFGLMLFATVLGHVSNIVINFSAARKEFQAKLDAVKIYMRMRRVPRHLQVKVIKWFDYLWLTQKSSDEEKSVSGLPDKLKAEIAIHVHLDTLKRVEIFQNTEAGFLCELVLRLRPVLFSPGDYICRKGGVGKEMYIVNRGRLQVVADDGRTVLATLKAGSYFGEISILNMGTAGNRRTASVRSVGYSDLFVLSKKDMWDVLKEYPAARVRLEAIAVKRLEKYKKAPLQKAALGRSHSTPGLVESSGRIPLDKMELPGNLASPQPPPSGPPSAAALLPSSSNLDTAIRSSDVSSSSTASSYRTSRRSSALQQVQPHYYHGDHSGGTLLLPSSSSGSRTNIPSAGKQLLPPADAMVAEISRLRERLLMLESENASLSAKLNRQQWEVENRLAEIEMQICGAGSPVDSATDDNERNFESAI